MSSILIRISAVDCRGRSCCPDLFCARALGSVEVTARGDAPDDVLREAERLRRHARLVLRAGGRALMAALVELLAGAGDVVCRGDGVAVETESLAARLRAGAVWS